MRPNQDFSYVANNQVQTDSRQLMRLYYPLIGQEGLALYQYFIAFWDNGLHKHRFSEILNHLMLSMDRFQQALAVLTAVDLVDFYQKDQDYIIFLREPLSAQIFLDNAVFRNLLEQKIGSIAVKELDIPDIKVWNDLSKTFSDVFDFTGSEAPKEVAKTDFDLVTFKQVMARDGLSFTDESKDVLALYNLSEQYGMTWYDTYQLAKDTAVNDRIVISRMKVKKESLLSANVGVHDSLTGQEQVILREARSSKPDEFLAKIKQSRRAQITADERSLLRELAEMDFLDETINIMVLYTLNKTKSANLKKNYLMKIANDFSYQEINRAEDAIIKMRSFKDKKVKQKASLQAKSNIPEWSNQNYKNLTSQDEQTRLEELKRQRLAKLGKAGD